MYASLREFVAALEREGELVRIKAPVSPVLEIAAIADRVSESPAPNRPSPAARANDPRFHGLGGPALLFENVEGSDIPVLINAYGSYRRMEMALGCGGPGSGPTGFEAIAARLGELVKPEPPASFSDLLGKARKFAPLLRIPPRRVRRGACQEVVLTGEAVDLTRLPMIRCWPLDGDLGAVGFPGGINDAIPGASSGPEWEREHRGRYITFAGIHTIHADDAGKPRPASHNIGMYRVQLLGPRLMAMHWHMHHDGARHWRSWKARGEPMPVAIALGGQSVLPYAATAPMPPGMSELLMAGLLNGRGIPMVRARSVPLWVPADAEIVIEGFVSVESGFPGWEPDEAGRGLAPLGCSALGPGAALEGPFGDHTGFYSLPDRYPLLEVTAITRRRDPIYPTTIVGLPPQEDYYMGKATERIFLPLLRTIVPDIRDYDLPMFGAFHNCAFLKIDKQYPLQARRVMHAVWGAGQMSWTKTVFVVDEDVDVHDTEAVLRRAAELCDPGRDIETVHGPLDILDHAAPWLGAGGKAGFDCTRKREGEQIGGENPSPVPDGGGVAGGDGGGSPSQTPANPFTPRQLPTPAQAAAALARVRALEGILSADLPEQTGGWLFIATDPHHRADRPALDDLAQRIIECWEHPSVVQASGPLSHNPAAPASGSPPPDSVEQAPGPLPPFLILLGPAVDTADVDQAMFHLCANADMSRDLTILHAPSGAHCAVFDATPKPAPAGRHLPVRPWPPLIVMDEATSAKVSRRWGEYGLGGA